MSIPALPTDLSQLHAFVRVVEARSFSEAARRAGTATSAMSKAIARFERAHGVRLLHRTTHSIALTDEGDRLVDAARTLFENLEKVEASLAEIATGKVAGRVRITAPTSFARACIMPRSPDFLRDNPTLQIEIKFQNEILDLAAEGVDLAIRSGPLDLLPGHQARKLFTFPWIACASPAYLAARGTAASPEDLVGRQHVGFRNPATGLVLSWRFSNGREKVALRFTPEPTHVFDDAHSSLSLVREGFGISWAPAWIVADDPKSGRLVEVMKAWRVPEEPLWMVRTSSRQAPHRTLRAMEFLGSLASTWKF